MKGDKGSSNPTFTQCSGTEEIQSFLEHSSALMIMLVSEDFAARNDPSRQCHRHGFGGRNRVVSLICQSVEHSRK